MVALKIHLKVQEGKKEQLKQQFATQFVPAISWQRGFYNALLLEQFTDENDCLILLFFDTEEQRKDWVKSEEHDPAWNKIAELCDSTSAKGYEIVDKAR